MDLSRDGPNFVRFTWAHKTYYLHYTSCNNICLHVDNEMSVVRCCYRLRNCSKTDPIVLAEYLCNLMHFGKPIQE